MSDREELTMGYRLITAEILYQNPHSPHLLESFLWQDYDIAPEYPELARFLSFWAENMDGTVHSVRYATPDGNAEPMSPAYMGYSLTMH